MTTGPGGPVTNEAGVEVGAGAEVGGVVTTGVAGRGVVGGVEGGGPVGIVAGGVGAETVTWLRMMSGMPSGPTTVMVIVSVPACA